MRDRFSLVSNRTIAIKEINFKKDEPLKGKPSATLPLKVGGNEKQWESGRSQMLGNSLGPWRSRFIYNLNIHFLNKNHISVSALSSKMNKRLLRH
jgi:hypothetical protein